MSPRKGMRTQQCDPEHARTRSRSAAKFLEVARLVQDEDEAETRSVAASLAVLAGIAASDAACCSALGVRSRAESHHDAEELLATVRPDGGEAAKALRRLINLKDKAQYGIVHVSRDDLKVAMKQAQKLVEFAEAIVRR